MSLNDSDLIVRVLADDDRHAFGELVRRHQSAVRSFLHRLCRDVGVPADDLAQETFITAYRQLRHYRGEAAFTTWLFGIAYNQFRSARRQTRVTIEWTEECPANNAEPAFTSSEDLKQDLAQALQRLSSDEQAAIQLCYGEGLSHQAAAEALDTPLGTIKTNVLRAKEKLRIHLRAWAPS